MSANIVELGEGIRDALNAHTFSQDFDAIFSFNANFSNMDAKTLRVVVTDAGGDIRLIGRQSMQMMDTIDVVILHRVDSGATGIDDAKVNSALVLMDEITAFLIRKNIAEYSPQGVIRRGRGDGAKQHYMRGDLEDRLFASAIAITYATRVALNSDESS
jgi:hypothetical protein